MYANDENLCENNAQVSETNERNSFYLFNIACYFFLLRSGDPLIIFVGGLPRSSYSNKHSVSCLTENEHDHNNERTRHVTFDFTTAVIDFFTIDKISNDGCKCNGEYFSIQIHDCLFSS